jgi:DNA-binding transcriptional regulator YhcF (GntR family)
MEFNDNKPIYRQIVDHAFNMIIDGKWPPGERIPSVREMSAEMGVNTRTVLKAMEDLQGLEVIESRRGMGFILCQDARLKVTEARRREFFEVTLPAISEEMARLGISKDDLIAHL